MMTENPLSSLAELQAEIITLKAALSQLQNRLTALHSLDGPEIAEQPTISVPNGFGSYFEGNVHVNGALIKSGGTFKIDHPLDPANKYLSHSFVESPDMMNIYNGNATLDWQGEACVEMPDWFEALNMEFRYQLTALDQAAPNLHISQRIKKGCFKIAGGLPGQEISWQVTGIRQDAWANAHRIQIEETKSEADKGKYIYPEGFGKSAEDNINLIDF